MRFVSAYSHSCYGKAQAEGALGLLCFHTPKGADRHLDFALALFKLSMTVLSADFIESL